MHGEQDDVSASGGFRRDPKSVLELLVGLELALKPSILSYFLHVLYSYYSAHRDRFTPLSSS